MKADYPLIAERRAALHCDALMHHAQPRDEGDHLPDFTRLVACFASYAERALLPFCGNETRLKPGKAENIEPATLAKRVASVAANSLYGLSAQGTASLLLSLDAGAIFRMVDRCYGGRGAMPAKLPASLPPAADLMAQRVEHALAAAMGDAMAEIFAPADRVPPHPLARHHDLAKLPFPATSGRIFACTLEVTSPADKKWAITLAIPCALFALLTRSAGRPNHAGRQGDKTQNAGPAHTSSLEDIPLPLRAVLVDMRMPLSALGTLAPGAVLPIALARKVPLSTGKTTLAHGLAGEIEDRAAIKLTEMPIWKEMS